MLSTLRWGRIVIAGVLSEAGVIAVLLIAIAVYSKAIAPGMSPAEKQTLGERAGYYVAPTAGFVTTLAAAFWAVRGLESGAITSGFLVGTISVLIALPFAFTAKPEHRFMYGVAFAARLVAGYLAGRLGGAR
jgi:hypothetical protein